jgi:hypothetical protein
MVVALKLTALKDCAAKALKNGRPPHSERKSSVLDPVELHDAAPSVLVYRSPVCVSRYVLPLVAVWSGVPPLPICIETRPTEISLSPMVAIS